LKRPVGFTILALILAWLAIAGFGNAVIQLNSNNGSTLMAFIALSYGGTALVSTLGLWKLKKWVYHSFLAWSATVILMLLVMQFGMYGIYQVSWVKFIGFSVFVLALLASLTRYIKKKMLAVAQQNLNL